ncbi:MAG TPA: protease pro-enzyme activation domain-containing protein, partial [Terracidiphilus sp.]|nr:protease pro-enzyme activation domain-containing protein [Terracidiphilus sp.]
MNRHPIAVFCPSQPACSRRISRYAASALCALVGVALLCVLPSAPARAQAPESVVSLSEHTPPQILDGTAARIGHYNSAQKLRLTLSIKPPHMAEEEEFLRELADRTSPNFHKFLSPDEWNARFGPSVADEQAVVDWAVSQGFTITKRFNHRLIVDVEAPASVIEKAFGVTIDSYQVGEEADFSNDRDPVIPAHLQGVVINIQGLNNIQRDHGSRPGPHTKAADYAEGPAYVVGAEDHADAKAPRPALSTTSNDVSNSTLFTNGYANPTEIYSSQVYNYDGLQNLGHCCNPHNDSGGTPNVSNIAIAAFGNVNGSDIVGFAAAYPYLAYDWTYYDIDGSINCTTDPGDCPSGETTQDTEWTIATANSFGSYLDTSHIYVYIGGNYNNSTFTDIYSHMLSDNTARVFTTSWSCTEVYGCSTSTMDARHNIFNSMVGQGWTLIAASGDRGSADDCNFNNPAHESAAYPGSDYDVLAAGGTQLMVYSDGSWDYEHGWQGGTFSGACGENDGGSGGGVSSYYGKPGFQSYSTWNSRSKRSAPDISLNALGIGQNLYINGNLQCCANGTSIVAPELAGFFAQENAYLNYIGHVCGTGTSACTPVGNPMPFFYPAAYYNDASHFPFYDMLTGCNNNDITAADGLGYYCSGTGWDYVTGWGSANMLQLAWAINWYLIPASGTPSLSWSGPTTGKWYNSDQIISWTVNDYGGGTYPGTGIGGFTQGWDSIPPDSGSKPHGGTGDTFWSGPQYANASTGCLSFAGAGGCAGGASQGCHTAHVRGWNNQGWTTGDATYGSVCYDTVAPTISIGTNPGTSYTAWVNQSVVVTLTASDSGGGNASGISTTYYAINSGSCYPGNLGPCSVYTGPFTISGQQQSYIYYFT